MRKQLGYRLNPPRKAKAKAKACKTKSDPLDQTKVEKLLAGCIGKLSLDDKPYGDAFTLVYRGETLCTMPTVRYGKAFEYFTKLNQRLLITPLARNGDTIYCVVDGMPYVANTNPDIARGERSKRTQLAFNTDERVDVEIHRFEKDVFIPHLPYVPCVGDYVATKKGKLLRVRAILSSWCKGASCFMTCIF